MSKPEIERVIDLVLKYRQGALLPAEQEELQDWINQTPAHQAIFDGLTNDTELYSRIREDWNSERKVWDRVRQRIGAFPEPDGENGTPAGGVLYSLPARAWIGRAAAVAVILVLTVVSYRLFYPKPQKEIALPVASSLKGDIAPGGNKAVLTLGDGSAIMLDQVQNGMLTRQGGTVVSKSSGGQLIYSVNEKPTAITYNTLTTPRAGQFQVLLPDDTRVWLNNASSLRYPTAFSAGQRAVELTGEAYFEVAPRFSSGGNGKRVPFIVNILPAPGKPAGARVEVVGTHFNVMAYSDEAQMKATLLEGAVNFSTLSLTGEQTVKLEPGQQARTVLDAPGRREINVLSQVDGEKVIAWKNGYFHFDRSDIREVMRQLARWYDVTVEYEGKITTHHFDGRIQRDLPLMQLLEDLQSPEVHFQLTGRKLIVRP